MKRLAPAAILLVLATAPALADERTMVHLRVGEATKHEVGFAMGHHCDNPEVVAAEMKNKTRETNVFVVRGAQVGSTLCRVGTYAVEGRPTFLFEIVVEAAPVAPARPAKPPSKR